MGLFKLPPILLASTSVYRAQQLRNIGLEFECCAHTFDENLLKDSSLPLEELCLKLSIEKANSLKGKYPNHLIIGGDQVLSLNSQILSKPITHERATDQLQMLQGENHILFSGLAIIYQNKVMSHYEKNILTMRSLSHDQIDTYLKTDLPYQCCGSYRIESVGLTLFEKIVTNDFTSITGLPLIKLSNILSSVSQKM